MLIWFNKQTGERNIYIHIPKNSGKYIRGCIKKNKENRILKGYWGVENDLDLAHIPYVKRRGFINERERYNYITYSRNPYDRLISAFYYKNNGKEIDDFKKYCKEGLPKLIFNNKYNNKIIHYYPQYLFICDKRKELIKIKIKRIKKPKKYDIDKYYDDETLKIVNRIYKRDFEILNYKIYNNIIEWKK